MKKQDYHKKTLATKFSHSLRPTTALEHSTDKAGLLESVKQQVTAISKMDARAAEGTVNIPLTTVSESGNFDAYIHIRFRGQAQGAATTLLVDSGNSMLIVPYYEEIEGLEGYTVLGQANEPWGSPANVVQGPIELATTSGDTYTLENCIFYACTGGTRTANFGAGRPTPWSANGWNTPLPGIVMQAPLSYNTKYPFAEFNYEAAETVLAQSGSANVSGGSLLTLYSAQPEGYTLFNTIPNLEWMSVVPINLWIAGIQTGWPGNYTSAAFVDTGGGPMFLSDPSGYIYPFQLPNQAACPTWAASSLNCNCTSAPITLQLMDPYNYTTWTFTADTSKLPQSVQGLSLVACQQNNFMMGKPGMNIGGISALFNYILINYATNSVGFKLK